MMAWTEVLTVTMRREWSGKILKDRGLIGLAVCEGCVRERKEDIKGDISVSALDR